MKLVDTPVESYALKGKTIWVKREDCCVPDPGPPFSKVRGLLPHMKKLKKEGIKTVGYVESSISMAGWGIAWIAKILNMRCVLYDPQYKETPRLLKIHRSKWKLFDPEIRKINAGMIRINYNICSNRFKEEFPENSVMLDLGIPLEETIEETAKVWRDTIDSMKDKPDVTVVNVGSGTILAGMLRGWKSYNDGMIIGVTGRQSDLIRKTKKIEKKSKKSFGGLFINPLELYNSGYNYTEYSKIDTPFPCHPYYDKKAWEWLTDNILETKHKILFWNIGRMI